jgi:hypothetical protein
MPRARWTGLRPSRAANFGKASVELTSSESSTPPGRNAGHAALNSNHMHSNECSLSCMNVSRRPNRSTSNGSSSCVRPSISVHRSFSSGGMSQPDSEPAGMPARPSPS